MMLKLDKLLHVENEPQILMLVRAIFQNVLIDEANSVKGAVAHIEFVGNNYDAIILDPGLEDSDGIATIREIHLCSDAPIVVHTGGDTREIEALSEALGVYEIAHKGTVTANGLRRAIEGAISKHELRKMEGLLKDLKEEKATYRQRLLKSHEIQ